MHHGVNPLIGFVILAAIGLVVMLPAARRGWRRGTGWAERQTVIVGLVCTAAGFGLLALLDYHRFRGILGFAEALVGIFAFVLLYVIGLFAGLAGLAAACGAAVRQRGRRRPAT